jgi:Na+-translocating ferredoxin:NAD+ oxidoreductase subunit G
VKLPETLHLTLTLAVAGLLAGITLVAAYQVTQPRIQANQEAALRRAVFQVLPGAEELQLLAWVDGELRALAPDRFQEAALYGGYRADGSFVGYAIPGAGPGFQDTIALLYGYDPAGRRVVGMEILESRETPGLGDKIFKDMDFVEQFRDLPVSPPPRLVKTGRQAPHEVDSITGATISAEAVVRIINQANESWVPRLPDEPPARVEPEPSSPAP